MGSILGEFPGTSASVGVVAAGTGGTNAADVAVKVGTSAANASLAIGAKVLSVRSGIGGTEVEKAFVTAAGDVVAAGTITGASLAPTMSPFVGVTRQVKAVQTANEPFLLDGAGGADGVAFVTGDRVLLVGQTTASENGIYSVAISGGAVYTRATDWATGAVVPEMKVYVSQGTTYSHSTWNLTTTGVITVGATGLTFAVAAAGLTTIAGIAAGGDLSGTYPNPALAPSVYSGNPYRQVRLASTANIVIASWGGAAIDGVNPVIGDRYLLKNQTTASENGIYYCAAGWLLVRAPDFVTGAVFPEMVVQVVEGTVQARTEWCLTTMGAITVGSTSLAFINVPLLGRSRSARLVATTNVGLSGLLTIDGSALLAGDRVLLTGQVAQSQNGIWVAASGAWTRPGDWRTGLVFDGDRVWVPGGTNNYQSYWRVNSGTPNVGVSDVVFINDFPHLIAAASDLGGSDPLAPIIAPASRPRLGNLHVVRVMSSSNLATPTTRNLSVAIDGVTLAEGDRILLQAQTTPSENGIWMARALGGWTRPYDFPAASTGAVLAECEVAVSEGTLWAHTYWNLTTPGSIVVDTTSLTFTQKSSSIPPTTMPLLGTSRIVNVASTVNVASLSGTLTIDGVQPLDGARVLIKNQTTQSQNGIYIANNSGAWTRATDWVTGSVLVEMKVFVSAGSTQAHTEWYVSSFAGGIVGTHACVFAQAVYVYSGTNFVGDVTGQQTSTIVPQITRSQSGNLIPVSAVSTSNLTTYYGPQTIDGVALANGDRYLLTAQSTASQNGIWTVSGASSVRMFSGYTLYPGTRVFIQGGTAKAQTEWVLTDAPASNGFIDGGTATQTWTQVTKTPVAPAALGASTGSAGTAIQLSPRDHVHAITYGTTANTVAQGNDSRFFSAAGGDLAGTYPNPTLATSVRTNAGQFKFCRITSTVNIATLTGLTAIDGVTPIAGDRILIKNQTTASQNGIYVAAAGAWAYASDWGTGAVFGECLVAVSEGTSFKHTIWQLTTQGTITVGTTALTFAPLASLANINGAGASDIVAKAGTTLTDGTVSGTAHLFSVRTGINNTEVEKAWFDGTGMLRFGITNVLSLGTSANASGAGGTALGTSATSSTNGTAVGNTASGGSYGTAIGYNAAATNYGFAAGAFSNAGSFQGAVALGYYSTAQRVREFVKSADMVATSLRSWSILDWYGTTTTATPADLGLDGGGSKATLLNSSAFQFTLLAVARNNVGNVTKGWEIKGVISRGANAASTLISSTSTDVFQIGSADTWDCVASADTTSGALKITVTGVASTTIYWNVRGDISEVRF